LTEEAWSVIASLLPTRGRRGGHPAYVRLVTTCGPPRPTRPRPL